MSNISVRMEVWQDREMVLEARLNLKKLQVEALEEALQATREHLDYIKTIADIEASGK